MGQASQPAPRNQRRTARTGHHLRQQRLGGGNVLRRHGGPRGFILHWNGRKWARQAIPSLGGPARDTRFVAVAAGAATGKAWVVGSYFDGTTDRTLILAWTGTAWVRQASPTQGDAFLQGAATTAADNAWAVGAYDTGTRRCFLDPALERDEMGPGDQPQPKLHRVVLNAVATSSASDAWAVGQFTDDDTGLDQNFAIHCCD